jgi:uncharacterized protein YoxC
MFSRKFKWIANLIFNIALAVFSPEKLFKSKVKKIGHVYEQIDKIHDAVRKDVSGLKDVRDRLEDTIHEKEVLAEKMIDTVFTIEELTEKLDGIGVKV